MASPRRPPAACCSPSPAPPARCASPRGPAAISCSSACGARSALARAGWQASSGPRRRRCRRGASAASRGGPGCGESACSAAGAARRAARARPRPRQRIRSREEVGACVVRRGPSMSTPDLTEPQQVSESDQARRLRNGLVSLAILLALIVGLLLAVPGLHGVGEVVADMSPGWVGAAILLEVLSCLGYVLIFLTVFDRAPIVFGARVALTEMAFGAAVSLGGAGSIAVGAWLLHERGIATGRIAERSAVLFLLTSAINLFTLAGTALAMGLGILPGPRNPLLTFLPAGVAIAICLFFLLLPRLTERGAQRRGGGRLATALVASARTIRATRTRLLRPDWRLLGAIGY